MTFGRRKIPMGAKQLREQLGDRASYIVPALRKDMIGRFYRWCQTYSNPDGPRYRTFPGECTLCGDGHYVTQGRYRELKACPRWDAETKRCRPS